jgi:PAS domain S-box-containing protein
LGKRLDMSGRDKTKEELINELADLRHRISALEAAETERTKYRDLVENSNDVLYAVDKDGVITYVSPAIESFIGYHPSEVVGHHFTDLAHPEDLTRLREGFESILASQTLTNEYRILAKSGQVRWMRTSSRPILAGNQVIGVQGILVDITERVEAERVLEKHNLNLALLNQVSQALIATSNLPRILEQLLRAAARITTAEGSLVWLWDEERAGELTCRGALLHDEFQMPQNLRLRPGQSIAGWVAQRGQPVAVANAQDDPRFLCSTDRRLGIQTTSLLAVPLEIRDHISGVLEVVNKRGAIPEDGTVGFDAEDHVLIEMLAASATAAIDNARLIEALRQYGMELEARNQELDEFAHSVAHDLKNPLGQVVGFADLLEKDYAATFDQDVRQSLHTIAQTGRKMSNIIDELLLLAGVRRQEKVELVPLDMANVVAEAQRRLTDLIKDHQAEVILPSEDDWPLVLGYGPWIEEVWVNYLSNAIHYGGRPPRVELGATEQADGTVRFWVRDNGDGLTPVEQTRLFKSFERLDRVRAKGHGLGLSIVRRIVEKLGGQVAVESEKGVGSIFSFTLPSAAQ